jgi:hypothetical protein
MLVKLNVLEKWKNKIPVFVEDDLNSSNLEQRLNNFHTNELKEILEKNNWKKKCNTSHCFVGSKSIYLNGEELISYIESQVPKRNDNDRMNFLNETDKEIDSILNAYFFQDNLIDKGKILVQAGHFIPDLNNLKNSSLQSLNALEDGLKFIKEVYQNGGSADLMLYSNDLRMFEGGKIRDDFSDNLVIPENYIFLINEYVTEIKKITDKQDRKSDFKVFLTTEKKLYNKVSRDAKKYENITKEEFKYKNKNEDKPVDAVRYKTVSGIIIKDTSSGQHISQIKCDSACMRLNMLAEEMNYASLVNFYPTCAKKGIEERAMTAFNDINPNSNLNIFNVYKTYTCWVDQKSKFIYEHEAKK